MEINEKLNIPEVPGTGERIDREPEYICTLFN